ncbi:MAG: hypothetical protein O9253_00435, partial [Aquidulcibacter sp.]|nr:hypothetical protein [Aquidulcibacter sp.]
TKCSILGLPRCRGIPFAASRLETFTPSIATNSSNTNPSEAPPITAAPNAKNDLDSSVAIQ